MGGGGRTHAWLVAWERWQSVACVAWPGQQVPVPRGHWRQAPSFRPSATAGHTGASCQPMSACVAQPQQGREGMVRALQQVFPHPNRRSITALRHHEKLFPIYSLQVFLGQRVH